MAALAQRCVERVRRDTGEVRQARLVSLVDREDHLDFADLEELLLLRGDRARERDQHAASPSEREEERDRVRGEVGLDRDDGAGDDAFALEARAPVADAVEEPAVAHGGIAPDERVCLPVRLEDVEQEVDHPTPPR